MKRTNGFEEIWLDLYGVNVYWIVCSREEYSLRVKKEFGDQAPVKSRSVGATYEEYEKENQIIIVLWFSPKSDVTVVAHECFHAAYSVLNSKGLRLSDASEEAYAYLIQYLMCKILSVERNKS